ncbi:MAG TPA: IclR family transcriptional regulator [Sphingomonadaceae bacterium]|nr:IclR family transcriptional regulator [Sphingomonadaceae bacterium]
MVKANELTGTIERTLRALQCVAERGEFALKDFAEEVGIPTSTAYRLLQSLGAANFVEKATHGNYRVGRELVRLASLIIDEFDYAALAHPFLLDLADRFQETCAFALYLPKEHAFTIIDTINAAHPLQYIVEKYTPRAMVWGALGRSMLPFLPDKDVRAAIEKQGAPIEKDMRSITMDDLKAEAETILHQGCFVATSPNALGTNGTAAPVFNSKGQLLGSLGVTVPIVRYDPALQPEISAAVIEAAKGLSAALGFVGGGRRKTRPAARLKDLGTGAPDQNKKEAV